MKVLKNNNLIHPVCNQVKDKIWKQVVSEIDDEIWILIWTNFSSQIRDII